MDRPKRVVNKPSRYQTTSSSDDETARRPVKRAYDPSTTTDAEIDEDISDLRGILENRDNIDNIILSQSQKYSKQDYSQISTNAPPHTYQHTYTTLTTYATPITYTTPIAYTTPTTHTTSTTHTTLSPSHTFTNNYNNNNYTYSNSSTHIPTRTRTDRVVYNSNTTDETRFQANVEQGCELTHYHRGNELSQSIKNIHQSINLLQKRTDGIEAELKTMNTLLQNVLKHVQDHRGVSRKPAILPISSLTEMEDFENSDENCYTDVVMYFQYIGCFNLKEAIHFCFKEALKDSLTPSFTWWGREGGQKSLYNARIILAIYEAMCKNKHFAKPTRSEFQAQAKEALRAAKERARSKLRGPRARMPNPRMRNRDFWNDEGEPEEREENQ